MIEVLRFCYLFQRTKADAKEGEFKPGQEQFVLEAQRELLQASDGDAYPTRKINLCFSSHILRFVGVGPSFQFSPSTVTMYLNTFENTFKYFFKKIIHFNNKKN